MIWFLIAGVVTVVIAGVILGLYLLTLAEGMKH